MVPLGLVLARRARRARVRQPPGDGVHRRRGARHPRPRGADPAREPHRRGGRREDGAARRARAAAERRRVARLGRHDVPRQDGDAHRARRCAWSASSRCPASATTRSRADIAALAAAHARAQPHAGGAARGLPGTPPRRSSPRSRSPRAGAGARVERAGGGTLLLGAPGAVRPRAARGGGARGRRAPGGAWSRVAAGAAGTGAARAPTRRRRPRRSLGLVVLAEQLRDDARETVALPARAGRRPADPLRRRAGDRRRDRRATPASTRERRAPSTGATCRPTRDELRRRGRRRVGDRADLARRQAARRRGARRARALRRDGRRRRQRRPGAQGGPARRSPRAPGRRWRAGVADVVLVQGDFAAVPPMVGEGRTILRNVQRVARLFVTKSVFAAVMIVAFAVVGFDYPFLPRQLSLAATLTIGVPAFFLALAPSSGPWRPDGLVREIARFAVPAGLALALGVLVSLPPRDPRLRRGHRRRADGRHDDARRRRARLRRRAGGRAATHARAAARGVDGARPTSSCWRSRGRATSSP